MARYSHPEFSGRVDLSSNLMELVEDMAALGSRVDVAVKRAMRKTHRWLRTHSAREIGKALGIKQATLKSRFLIDQYSKGGSSYLTLWVGLQPVAADQLGGTARQNRRGVRTRGRQFDGAFYQTVYGSEKRVWIRTSRNRREGHTTVANRPGQKNKHPSTFISRNRDRFPVQLVGVDIEEVALPILQRYEQRTAARFREILQAELNYELNVRGRTG